VESGDEEAAIETASSQGEGAANGSGNGKKDRKKKAKEEEFENDDDESDESDGVFGMIFPLQSSYFVLMQMSFRMINLGSSLFFGKISDK